MKIGIFDSGVGGQAVAESLQAHFSDAEIIVVNDSLNVPYGSRSRDEVIRLTDRAIQPLLDAKSDIIIIACNTATALAIDTLRIQYPRQKFIGFEPMLKPASQLTRSKVVTVLATPATVKSQRYQELKRQWLSGIRVVEPDVSDWAHLIETNQLTHTKIKEILGPCLQLGTDAVILDCTHYHWIKPEIVQLTTGFATVLDPTSAVRRQIVRPS